MESFLSQLGQFKHFTSEKSCQRLGDLTWVPAVCGWVRAIFGKTSLFHWRCCLSGSTCLLLGVSVWTQRSAGIKRNSRERNQTCRKGFTRQMRTEPFVPISVTDSIWSVGKDSFVRREVKPTLHYLPISSIMWLVYWIPQTKSDIIARE